MGSTGGALWGDHGVDRLSSGGPNLTPRHCWSYSVAFGQFSKPIVRYSSVLGTETGAGCIPALKKLPLKVEADTLVN